MKIGDLQSTKDIVIGAFKSYAFLIFEVSKDETITAVWSADPEVESYQKQKLQGIKMADIRNDAIVNLARHNTAKTFETGEKGIIEYNTEYNGEATKFIIRIIPAPYDDQHVLILLERVNKEQNREIVEDKWKIALDAAGDGMWDMNLETGKIYFSPKWHELFGYSENEISTAEEWNEKIFPDDIIVARKSYDTYINGFDTSYSAEIRYRCKDGNYRWILSRGIIAGYTEDGKPARLIGTHTDIHFRKLQEMQIMESEKNYKILFDYSEALICTHDLEGRIITINPFVTRSLGYLPIELIGKKLSDIIPRAHRDRFDADYLAPIRTKGAAEGVMQILSKDGTVKTLLYKNYLFGSAGSKTYVIGFAQDISARIRIEEELKNSVDTFSSAFNYSGIGMALVSPDGKWMGVNNALCDILGYTRPELLKLTFQDITHPDDLDGDMHLVTQMLNKEIDSYTLEKRYMAKSGKIIWAALTVSLVWNKDGTPKFFISQIVDVTAQKELTNEISDKNIQLENTQKNLVNKVSQLEELSYIIAHNLRGPARNINLLSNVLKHKQGKTDVSEDTIILSEALSTDESISMIDDAATALLGSLESLLDIAEIQLNKNIPFDLCHFEELIQHVILQLRGDILDKHVQIKKQLHVADVYYPKAYLESILYNLISNAIKYSNPAVPPVITITTEQEGNMLLLSVKDNGLGIDLAKHGDKIFKLNQVFHANKDSKGIGLHLIKTQIESLGGSITVNSSVNEGSEFIIQLETSPALI